MNFGRLSLALAFLAGVYLLIPLAAPWLIIKALGVVASLLFAVESYLTYKAITNVYVCNHCHGKTKFPFWHLLFKHGMLTRDVWSEMMGVVIVRHNK